MAQWDKVLRRVLSGKSDANIDFDTLCGLLEQLGYQHDRVHGSHHIFLHPPRPEIINIQPRKDGKAKDYQVKQIRRILVKYGQIRIR